MENLKEKYPNGTLVVVDIYTDIENNDYYTMTGKVVGIECGWRCCPRSPRLLLAL